KHYRCLDDLPQLRVTGELSTSSGFFKFGDGIMLFGRCSTSRPSETLNGPVKDIGRQVVLSPSVIELPFDPARVLDNLYAERYVATEDPGSAGFSARKIIRSSYYFLRPMMGVPVRKHLQRLYFWGRLKTPFPHWPVDRTVENLLERLLILSMRAKE